MNKSVNELEDLLLEAIQDKNILAIRKLRKKLAIAREKEKSKNVDISNR